MGLLTQLKICCCHYFESVILLMMFPQLVLLQVTTKYIMDFIVQVGQHSVLRLL